MKREILPICLFIIIATAGVYYQKISRLIDFDGYYGKILNKEIKNFSLKNSDGKNVFIRDYEGQFVYLFFGFTVCHGVCPLNLAKFKQIKTKLLAFNHKPLFIFVSIDTIRDDGSKLKKFLASYDQDIIGLISGEDDTLNMAKEFNNFISLNPKKLKNNPDMQIQHSGAIYLLNKKCKIFLTYYDENVDTSKVRDRVNA